MEKLPARLIFAKTLHDDRSAIVVQTNLGLIGGVVWVTEVRIDAGFKAPGGTNDTMEMKFVWQWWKIVDSPEDFAQRREWESIATPPRQLEHK